MSFKVLFLSPKEFKSSHPMSYETISVFSASLILKLQVRYDRPLTLNLQGHCED